MHKADFLWVFVSVAEFEFVITADYESTIESGSSSP